MANIIRALLWFLQQEIVLFYLAHPLSNRRRLTLSCLASFDFFFFLFSFELFFMDFFPFGTPYPYPVPKLGLFFSPPDRSGTISLTRPKSNPRVFKLTIKKRLWTLPRRPIHTQPRGSEGRSALTAQRHKSGQCLWICVSLNRPKLTGSRRL